MSTEINTTKNAEFNSVTDLIMMPERMTAMMQFANLMAGSQEMVPKHYRDSPSSCMAVIMQAMRWGMDPFAVAQKTHIVQGTLGYESQLINAVVTSSSAIEGRFHYQYGGDWGQNDGKSTDPTRWVKVGAVLRGEPEIQWSEPLYPASVTIRNSPLWKTNEKQQSTYLAIKLWSRLYCPQVILGVYSSDELMDMPRPEHEINPGQATSAIKRPEKLVTEVDKDAGQSQSSYDESQSTLTFAQYEQAIFQETDLIQLHKIAADIRDNTNFDRELNGELATKYKERRAELESLETDAEDNQGQD
jgi:RecT family